MNKLYILDIIYDTTVDGPGFRTAIYAAGCKHQCKGCHNSESWKIEKGKQYILDLLLEKITENEFSNVTFSGGDPLFQVEGFTELAKLIKQHTNKTIWCYTGFTFEQIRESEQLSQILPFIDVLVDGKYMETMRNTYLRFRGSENQRLINIKESLKTNDISLWN